MRHEKLVFDGKIVEKFKTPSRPGQQLKFCQALATVRMEDVWGISLSGEEAVATVRRDPCVKTVYQNNSTCRRGCRGKEQRMVTPRSDAGGCPAGKSAEPVRFKPFGRIRYRWHTEYCP